MKLEIFEESKAEEPEVFLKLVKEYSGIRVVAVDKAGKEFMSGNLLTFSFDGSIFLHSSINPDLGFKLEGRRRLVTQLD